jgi:4-hydroxy-L-threonine phosphate dehydrogenase PdxA
VKPALGLAFGDPTGIGPELCLRTALAPEVRALCRPVLFGDPRILAVQARAARIDAPVRELASAAEARDEGVALVPQPHFAGELPPIGTTSAETGRAAIAACAAAIRAALAGELHAVVAAPQNQKAIALAGISFDGYPRFVAEQTGLAPEDVFLMLCFGQTRIVHVTLHVSVRRALELLTRERILRALRAADEALRRLGVASPERAGCSAPRMTRSRRPPSRMPARWVSPSTARSAPTPCSTSQATTRSW